MHTARGVSHASAHRVGLHPPRHTAPLYPPVTSVRYTRPVVTMQKKNFFKVIFWKMASRSYNAEQVLDLLDVDSSDSGSSGEKGDDI